MFQVKYEHIGCTLPPANSSTVHRIQFCVKKHVWPIGWSLFLLIGFCFSNCIFLYVLFIVPPKRELNDTDVLFDLGFYTRGKIHISSKSDAAITEDVLATHLKPVPVRPTNAGTTNGEQHTARAKRLLVASTTSANDNSTSSTVRSRKSVVWCFLFPSQNNSGLKLVWKLKQVLAPDA